MLTWNYQHKDKKEMQTQPPVLKFTNPEDMLNKIFSKPDINLETIKGEWPDQWCYYDEPSNREGLLNGRKAHNLLLSAEKLFSSVKMLNPNIVYPKTIFDSAWMANCWPDHGWGGNNGLYSDSIYHDSYLRSYTCAQYLMQMAIQNLRIYVPNTDAKKIPLVVYNSLNWTRKEAAKADFILPKDWKGFVLEDKNNQTIPFEIIERNADKINILFNADVPASAYTIYYIEPSKDINSYEKTLSGDSIDNAEFKVVFGNSGIKQYVDKIKDRRYFKTDKFEAGEVLQFSAPGIAWDDLEAMSNINMYDFDKSGNYKS